MANKAISELPQAQNVNNQDLFVLEQGGIAKKLPAETFITEQGIINALAEALDGHGGIQSVTLSSVSGRIRTYRITFTDQSATIFQVYDGTSIDRISRTSSSGLDDVYTIFLSDGTTTFFTVHNGADGTVSEAMLNDALKNKAPVITETTESSAIANFTDGADDMPMQSVLVDIEPVQDLSNGDPSPSNICPISGHTGMTVQRTGANVWDEEWEAGSIDASTGNNNNAGTRIRSKNYIPIIPNVAYCTRFVMAESNTTQAHIECYYDADKNFISGGWTNVLVKTAPANARYMRFATNDNYGASYNNNISINYPATDTQYHPYQGGNTVTVDWTTEAGTVYGGTIDIATGLLTVTHASVTLDGTNDGTYQQNGQSANTTRCFIYITGKAYGTSNFLSSMFATGLGDVVGNMAGRTTNTGIEFYLPVSVPNTLEGVVAWFAENQPQLVYELATPQTYQLTPQEVKTLLGTNNAWADTGNVTVTYPADTKMFIEKLTMPTEDDLVANQAITSGKYFMVGNSLYLALANIASGAQITIGTNAQRVSLADALNTINS